MTTLDREAAEMGLTPAALEWLQIMGPVAKFMFVVAFVASLWSLFR